MINYNLEEIAKDLRKTLGIDEKIILTPQHMDELIKKVETEYFKIERTIGNPYLLLEKEKYFTLNIRDNHEDGFHDLVEQLTFAILLDEKSLNYYQLQHSVFNFPRLLSRPEGADANYLMLAFIMPKDTFYSLIIKYSNGDGSMINMTKMEKEVNKYCYKRGKYLGIF